MMGALRQEGENDYTLEEDYKSCWITVDNISVYVIRRNDHVSVEFYPLGQEMHDPIIEAWALFSEAEEKIENEPWSGNDGRGESKDSPNPWPGTQASDAE